MFGKDKTPDPILSDLMRGEEGREPGKSYLPRNFFMKPEALTQTGFNDNSADTFLGVVNGYTERIQRQDGRTEYKTTGGNAVGMNDDRHLLTIAGSRSGKGRSVIVPNLLTYGGSMVVIDPKGENACITARYRAETLKQTVCVLDPFGITEEKCAPYRRRFNPLDLLNTNNPEIIEDAGLIADALVVNSPQSKDPHWDDTARGFIEGLLLYVATNYRLSQSERNLGLVSDMISGGIMPFNELLAEMIESDELHYHIRGIATTMAERSENEQSSVLSTVRKHLKFLQYGPVQDNLSQSDFSLEDLQKGNMTLYLVLPVRRLTVCRSWLRLFVNLILASVEKAPTKPQYETLMILDEMAVLGYMRELETAIGQIAGYGLRIWSILQDLTQLKSLYKDRWESFAGNSGLIQVFGTVDAFTADYISKYLGQISISVKDAKVDITSEPDLGGPLNQRQQLQALMQPEEVRRYFARDDHYNRQLICIPGKRPIILQRANYDQHELFAGRFDSWR